MSNGNEPAYPIDAVVKAPGVVERYSSPGLTKRELFALELAKAWTVVLGQRQCAENSYQRGDEANRLGVLQADALLAELAK